QAEDGIRDDLVTGVQTCALPICTHSRSPWENESPPGRSPLVRATSAPVPSSWLHPRFASGLRQPAVRLRGHSGPAVRLILPGCAPWARVRDGSGENNRLLLPHLPFRALVR